MNKSFENVESKSNHDLSHENISDTSFCGDRVKLENFLIGV